MKKYWLLSAGIAALATPTFAHAQGTTGTTGAADAAAQPTDEAANEGEIVVTAQGRRQVLQDVPLAVHRGWRRRPFRTAAPPTSAS